MTIFRYPQSQEPSFFMFLKRVEWQGKNRSMTADVTVGKSEDYPPVASRLFPRSSSSMLAVHGGRLALSYDGWCGNR